MERRENRNGNMDIKEDIKSKSFKGDQESFHGQNIQTKIKLEWSSSRIFIHSIPVSSKRKEKNQKYVKKCTGK